MANDNKRGDLQKANEMILPAYLVKLLYHAKHINSVGEPAHKNYINEHCSEFQDLLNYIRQFADKFVDVDKNLSKIRSLSKSMAEYSVSEICSSFVNLLTLTALGAPADFKFFGTTIPRKRYGSPQSILSATLIHQSITGLYETRIDLSKLGED